MGPVRARVFFQFQRHRRHTAPLDDRRCGWLAARHADRRFGPQLSSSVKRLEIRLPAGLDCPSELPVEIHGFQVQQFRWAKGLTQCAKKLLPDLLRSKIPFRVKAEAIMHLTPNISYPLMMVISALMLPVMIVRFYMGVWQMMLLDFPLDRGVILVALGVLSDRPARTPSENMETLDSAFAHADGGWSWPDVDQHARRARSSVRRAKRLRAHPEICH